MEKKIVSIITVNLNNLYGLRQTVESVFSQTFKDFEYIIIDGCSVDGSKAFLNTYSDRLDYWVSETDLGIYHAMNKGTNHATGEYCLFLNSGDLLVDEYVLDSIFSKPHTADILVGNCNISKNGKVVFVAKPNTNLTLKSFVRNTLPHQATFIKRILFKDFGQYDERFRLHADYDFWLRTIIMGQCTVEKLNLVVADYNMEGLSSDVANNPDLHREANEILAAYFPSTVLADYYNWLQLETNELPMFRWLEQHPFLYAILKFLYKIAKNVRKITD